MPPRRLPHLKSDPANANKGTARGRALLDDSLRSYGAGRSALADKHGVLIAGNKTVEAASALGIPTRVVTTDGSELIVVQRTDLDLAVDARARELAYADNRVAEIDLAWDTEQLRADAEAGLIDLVAAGFAQHELDALLDTSTFDPAEEWAGMPAYQQDDQGAAKQLIVNFATVEDVAAFAERLGQPVSPGAKSIWFPHRAREDRLAERYEAEA